MATYGYATHTWQREEVESGLWLSLGMKVDDEVVEVTPRKFFSFEIPNGYGYGRARVFGVTEPTEFDHIVVSRKPAGAVADVLHNGRPQRAGPNAPVIVTPHWTQEPRWNA